MAPASASLRLLVLLPLLAACGVTPPEPRTEPVRPERSRGAHAPTPRGPAATDSEFAGIRLHVEPPVAAPGAEVALVLANGGSAAIGFNLCMSILERLSAHAWVPVPVAAVCTRELRTAAPGTQARYTKRLPAALPPGIYRYVTGVESPVNAAARHRRVEGEAFEVR